MFRTKVVDKNKKTQLCPNQSLHDSYGFRVGHERSKAPELLCLRYVIGQREAAGDNPLDMSADSVTFQ
jgi:hypothetical protein